MRHVLRRAELIAKCLLHRAFLYDSVIAVWSCCSDLDDWTIRYGGPVMYVQHSWNVLMTLELGRLGWYGYKKSVVQPRAEDSNNNESVIEHPKPPLTYYHQNM